MKKRRHKTFFALSKTAQRRQYISMKNLITEQINKNGRHFYSDHLLDLCDCSSEEDIATLNTNKNWWADIYFHDARRKAIYNATIDNAYTPVSYAFDDQVTAILDQRYGAVNYDSFLFQRVVDHKGYSTLIYPDDVKELLTLRHSKSYEIALEIAEHFIYEGKNEYTLCPDYCHLIGILIINGTKSPLNTESIHRIINDIQIDKTVFSAVQSGKKITIYDGDSWTVTGKEILPFMHYKKPSLVNRT